MSSPIADMVERMLSTGIPPEMIVLAVRTAEQCAAKPVDLAAEKRRAWDRERKRDEAFHRNPPEQESALTTLPSEPQNMNSEKKEKKVRANSNRGHVCPDDFRPSETHYEAGERLGVPRPRVDAICEKMQNWSKVNAHRAVARKSNWGLALHGWINDEAEKNGHGNSDNRAVQTPRRQPSGDDATLAGMGRIAARVAERVRSAGSANGSVPHGGDPPEIDAADLLGTTDARAPHS